MAMALGVKLTKNTQGREDITQDDVKAALRFGRI